MAQKLGQMLIKAKIISEAQLNQALNLQKKSGGRLGSNLVQLGYVTEDSLVAFLSKQFGVPSLNIGEYNIDPAVIKLIPMDMARKYTIMPVARVGAKLTIAMTDPSNIFAIDDVKFMTGYNVEVAVASETAILEAMTKYYGGGGVATTNGNAPATQKKTEADQKDISSALSAKDYTLDDMAEDDGSNLGGDDEAPMITAEDFDNVVGSALDNVEAIEDVEEDVVGEGEIDAPIVKLVNGILVNAVKTMASDIHIEPYEHSLRIRYRIDGVCHSVMNLPTKIKNAMTSRLKIMAKLDIAERRLPQDGRIKLKLGKKRDIDFRVSVLPTLFGEKTVMRILDKSNLNVDLTKLGFEKQAMDDFMECIESPYGMVLVTGPTGSGKTTTLYSALAHLNQPDINIMTAEDPVEFNFMGINQVHVKDEIGLSFAAALRSFLRQDPDIIMVGEIRDFETGEIAIKAALTGHLVLSTLHTNDAPGTISRLLNMGVEPFLIASSVLCILAQRLARRLCEKCKAIDNVPEEALIKVGVSAEDAKTMTVHKAVGCDACGGSGFKGRVALYEVMRVNENIKELVLEGASTEELKTAAIEGGMKTLRMAGLSKVGEGVTTIEEIIRVSMSD